MRNIRKFDTQTDYDNVKSSLALPNMCLLNDVYEIASEGDEDIIPVEYLQSTGTQWINTGIIGDINTEIEIKFNATETNGYACGNNDTSSRAISIYISSTGNQRFGNKTYQCNLPINTLHTIVSNKNGITINDTTYTRTTTTEFTTAAQLYIFKGLTNASTSGKLKVYYFKVRKNGKLIFDLIPVRVGNVGYMFDNISKKLFNNSGTGNFTLGQDIQVVEYLENTSTSRIHTGISGNLRAVGYAVSNQIKGQSQCLLCGHTTSGWFGEAVSTRKWGVTSGASGCAAISPTTPVTFDINYGSQVTGTINGLNITFSNGTARNEWAIFGSTSGSYPFVGKLYWLKFYQNNILVRDFIPVKVNNVGYMYDKVSRQLFGNVGSGSFTCGPVDSKRKITRDKQLNFI